jgi:redox-sensitive bicupin YhaK (pirin superfamily)
MTILIRRKHEHFHSDVGWLETRHHFSFNEYYDPDNLNWASLRVFNDDVIQPNEGFPFHSHADMEIVTYVISGELTHEDSLGNEGKIVPGMIQYMCAGTGIRHAEYNESKTTPVHLLQMWILPPKRGLPSSWSEKKWDEKAFENKLVCLVSKEGKMGALPIQQNASLYVSSLTNGKKISFSPSYPHQYIFVVEGTLMLNNRILKKGDSARVLDENKLVFEAMSEKAHLVMWDL